MCGEELNAVDGEGLCVDSISLNDGHSVIVDAEDVVRVAGQRHQAETVASHGFVHIQSTTGYSLNCLPFALLNVDHS